MDKLADLTRIAEAAVRTGDQDLGVGDRLANGIGPPFHLRGVEIGRAERLCQSVHQEGLRFREDGAEAIQGQARHMSTGVGKITKALAGVSRPLELRQLNPEWRHPGDAGYPFGGA